MTNGNTDMKNHDLNILKKNIDTLRKKKGMDPGRTRTKNRYATVKCQ